MDEIREAFEEWLSEKYPNNLEWRLSKFENGEYVSSSTVIQWEIWDAALAWQKTQPVDPWVNAPRNKCNIAYCLRVNDAGEWHISPSGIDEDEPYFWDKVVAEGHNADPSRDGETRTYDQGRKEFV